MLRFAHERVEKCATDTAVAMRFTIPTAVPSISATNRTRSVAAIVHQ